MSTIPVFLSLAQKVLSVVDAGLVSGLGKPIPGQMCVEAAVCYAMDLPHSDKPTCVAPILRQLKIALNDKNWTSPTARAKGLRRLAIMQLGTAGILDEKLFLQHVVEMTIRKIVPRALRAAISMQKIEKHKTAMEVAAQNCEEHGTRTAASEANAAASDASYASASDASAVAASAAYAAYASAASATTDASAAVAASAAYAAYASATSAASYASATDASAATAASAAYAAYASAASAAYASATDASAAAVAVAAYASAASAASYASASASAATAATAASVAVAAYASASAVAVAASANYDNELAFFCEEIVQILVAMKMPAAELLYLTE